ncbi:TIGR01777 family oxidoreductase [Nakamurella endophytica]|uniref:Epimerase n=1 Tax=Nakamurella endophytica TaxID=1748367 RepID=A0A917WHD4_9ACTN|nr:TIGR01777 family oxidoreductase [Nakamurella endophytica]GGM06625.1 epimerase [Nakamurella endophytica]
MRIVAAGVSGFIGSRLVAALRERGDEVVTLVRRPPGGPSEVRWDPDGGEFDAAVLDGADAVINLCGAGVGDHRWTDSYRDTILSSRVRPTALLAGACVERGVPALVNASAVGYYGHRGDERLDELAPAGTSFLAGVCVRWERAAAPAADGGVRVVHLRTGLVLGRGEGLLGQLDTVIRLGAGGRLGDGRQWCPWISIEDEVAAIVHLVDTPVAGAVNLSAPEPVRNAELVRAIGRALHRPTPWIVPGVALHLVVGAFADEILHGQRAVPVALEESGYRFRRPELADALRAELG